MSLNVAAVTGRMVRDPKVSTTPNGVNTCNFTLAVDRDIIDNNGEYITDFIDCIGWRQTADFIERYFHKGDPCTILGRIAVHDWTDKNGNKRHNTEIVVQSIYFGQKKNTSNNASSEWVKEAEQTEMETFEDVNQDDGGDRDGELPF